MKKWNSINDPKNDNNLFSKWTYLAIISNLHCIFNFVIKFWNHMCMSENHNECLSQYYNANKPFVRAPSGKDRVFLWTKESSSSPASSAWSLPPLPPYPCWWRPSANPHHSYPPFRCQNYYIVLSNVMKINPSWTSR